MKDFDRKLNGIDIPVKCKLDLGKKILQIMDQDLKQLREKMHPYRVSIFEEKAEVYPYTEYFITSLSFNFVDFFFSH